MQREFQNAAFKDVSLNIKNFTNFYSNDQTCMGKRSTSSKLNLSSVNNWSDKWTTKPS